MFGLSFVDAFAVLLKAGKRIFVLGVIQLVIGWFKGAGNLVREDIFKRVSATRAT